MENTNNIGGIATKHSNANNGFSSQDRIDLLPLKIDYKNEVIFYFFNAMLETVVDTWEQFGDIDCTESVASAYNAPVEPDDGTCYTDVAEEESMFRLSKYSFSKSAAQIDEYKKTRSSDIKSRISRKSIQNRKSKKSIRKSTSFKKSDADADSLQNIQSDDESWMIEAVKENVIITFQNGNVYEGPVFGKLMHGYGKFTWANGTTYVGNFKNGELTGHGVLKLNDTSHYEGDFLRGYRHGQGVMVPIDKCALYHGGWRAGRKQGQGWQQFCPNSWYDGEWNNDAMEGVGIRQYESGARYQGFWKNHKRHGHGCAIMQYNDHYTGDWDNGNRKGCGKYTWSVFYNKTLSVPVQSSYFGSWDKNVMHGIGLLTLGTTGGARYAGCYENNLKHGSGVIICENGSTVESNPLFRCNKPVHLTQSGSLNISSKSGSTSSTHDAKIEQVYNSISQCNVAERKESLFKMIKKQIYFPANHLDLATIANIDVCKLTFPKIQENYLSLCVPINTPSEMIVLNHYLKNIFEFLFVNNSRINTTKQTKEYQFDEMKPHNLSHTCCHNSPQRKFSTTSSYKEPIYSSVIDQLESEEKNLRRAITTHLPKLRAIYKQYTTIACVKILPFETLLIRLFLWQFYRDCKIPQKGMSLVYIDKLMAENPDTEMETEDGPFEIIYFWQFLHSLVTVAIFLYGNESSVYGSDGKLKYTFIKLLEEDIYPNYGHHRGCALFDYLDVLPLRPTYTWYLDFRPVTVLSFLRHACTIKKCDPPFYYAKASKTDNFTIRMGINAFALSSDITFLQDELPYIQTEPVSGDIQVCDEEIYKGLFFLRHLGAKTVLAILAQVCPNVIENNDIVDMKYELSFIEFYEVVLLCTQEYIDQDKEKKLKEMLAEQERLLRIQDELSSKERKMSRNTRKISKKKIHIQNTA